MLHDSKLDLAITETMSALMYMHMLRCGPPFVHPRFKEPGAEGREDVRDALERYPFIDSPLELAEIFGEVVDEDWVRAHAMASLEDALRALCEYSL